MKKRRLLGKIKPVFEDVCKLLGVGFFSKTPLVCSTLSAAESLLDAEYSCLLFLNSSVVLVLFTTILQNAQ